MPKLPSYTNNPGVQGPVGSLTASPSDFSTAFGKQAIAKGISDVGQGLAQYAKQKQIFEAEKTAMQGSSDWRSNLETMQQDVLKIEDPKERAKGIDSFTSTVETKYNEWMGKQLEDTEGSVGRKHLELSLLRVKNGVLGSSLAWQKDASAKNSRVELEQIFNKNRNTVLANPAMLDSVLAEEQALIKTIPFGDAQLRTAIGNKRITELWDSKLDGKIIQYEKNALTSAHAVDELIAVIKNPKSGYLGNTSDEMYRSALNRLEQYKKTLSHSEQKQFFADFDDTMLQIRTTGSDSPNYTDSWIKQNVKDPKQQARMLKEQDEARSMGAAVRDMHDLSDQEAREQLYELNKHSTSPINPGKALKTYEAARKAYSQREKALKDDPVEYVLNQYHHIKSIYNEFKSNPTPENAGHYAQVVMGEQERLNPLGAAPRLLSKSDTEIFKAQMDNVPKKPDGAPQALDILQKQLNTWGKHWPTVVNDLRSRNAINDLQYVAANLLSGTRQQLLGGELVKASLMDPKQFRDIISAAKKDSGEDPFKLARNEAQKYLDPLKKTLRYTPGDQAVYSAYENALTQFLLYHDFWNDEDFTHKAEEYANKMVLDDFDFPDDKPTFRIPKKEDPEAVKAGIPAAKLSVNLLDVVAPKDIQGTLPLKERNELYRKAVRDHGNFVTLGDESGVVLLDHTNRPVYHMEGGEALPIKFTWGELRSIQYKEIYDKVYNKGKTR